MTITYVSKGTIYALHITDIGSLDETLYDLVAQGIRKFSVAVDD